MNIINSKNNTSFQAYKVATASNFLNNKKTIVDIYKLTRKDKSFINKLENFIYIPDLELNIPAQTKRRWQQILNYAFLKTRNFFITDSYIAVSENRPCGILVTYNDKNKLCLDCISKFPLKENKDKNLVGKSLFYHLFKSAKDNKYDSIFLCAVNGGPFDVISKYKKLGFKETGNINCYTAMECNKFKIEESLNEMSNDIVYEKVNDSENVDLNQVCDII